eukprot:7784497-Prorocentrum_lima.AAC.1
MLRLSSGHSNHNLGCELWVRLDGGPSSECRFLAKHFAITLADPRCLVVACRSPWRCCSFIVARA